MSLDTGYRAPLSLTTARLRLRAWRPEDLPQFAALNADPRVMEHFPKVLTAQESDRQAAAIADQFQKQGFGFWAVEVSGVADFVGFVGLSMPSFEAHFTPCVEIGWRLAREHWGHGYATEAARAAADYGFCRFGLTEIVAFAVPANRRSRRVMEQLGMTHSVDDDFDHPRLPPGHPLRRHVLYRLRRPPAM
ncbi:MAG TPA: GNAT family N-acetyltransferase [Steroidobacteraceae bacterium]